MSNSDRPVFPRSTSFKGPDSEIYYTDAHLGLSNVLGAVPCNFGYLSPSMSQNEFGPNKANYGYSDHGIVQSVALSSHGPAIHLPSTPVNQNQPRSKDRPRCFEHGCEGGAFTCWENYRRHLQENNGSSSVVCTICGLFFSRKGNRDKHILDGKCKILIEGSVNAAGETITQAVAGLAGNYRRL